ncbi:hypothetical protein AAFF_G00157930 [Aldrovandia affinis]|uniref:Sulfotransferase n=1 Tax=Aldrovandia affinis TaxID=143900 RepID=A0AAD7W822_9TELE|nr:hypothetical protein AAFF_G00157930 [Aldrovandia affinis]
MNSSFFAQMQSRMERAQGMKEEDKLYRHNGVLYPTLMSPAENLEALVELEARPDDVMVVAYPKCGFNWMVSVMRKIIEASSAEKVDAKIPPLIEFFGPERLKYLKEAPSPRFIGTHMHPDLIPASFTTNKTKMLVIFRNPKDTVVSFYHFSNKNPVLPTSESWDQFYTEFMSGDVPWGSYFDHALAWEKRLDDPTVMVVTYEELKEDLCKWIGEISKFFSFTLSEEQAQSIAQESTFNAMKESSKGSHGQMSTVFFRKGEVGDWKNHFSEAQSKEMDAEFERRLAGTKLGARLKYDVYCK